jgi:GMP synthase-like glutamine amidotransferase
MHIHFLEHAAFENPGNIIDWAENNHYSYSSTRLYQNEKLPEQKQFDILVIMGGPMSISDDNKYPWIKSEKLFIREAISAGKKVLGICLGAQFLADALGAKVFRNQEKEIGWFNLHKVKETRHPLLDAFHENQLPAFHWHGDTFDIPKGATRLFESKATKNQAFLFDEKIIALQFHWEVKPDNIRLLLMHSAGDLTPGPFVQSQEVMLNQKENFDLGKNFLEKVMDYLSNQ